MRALIIATPGGSMIQNSGSTVVLACGVSTPIRPRGAYASDTVETPLVRCDLAVIQKFQGDPNKEARQPRRGELRAKHAQLANDDRGDIHERDAKRSGSAAHC